MNSDNVATGGVVHRKAGSGKQVWFSGDVYRIMLTAQDAGGSLGVTYASVPPGGGPPLHYHAEHDEMFYLLDGELTFFENDRQFTASRGDLVLVKKGTLHHFANQNIFPATMIFLYTPGGPEGLFIEGGDTPVPGQPTPAWGPERIDDRLLELLAKYDNVLPAPPTDRI